MKKILTLLGLILLAGAGCKKEVWKGFYYPDGCLTCEDRYIIKDSMKSLDECRVWANNIKKTSRSENDNYECGLNCKKKDGFNICDETLK